MNTRRSFLLYVVFLICFAAAFAAGYFAHDYLQPAGGNFSLLGEAYRIINRHGYYEIPADPTLEYGMIRGMAEAYSQANDDPYTRFVEPAQHELDADALEGSYGGIGAGIGADEEGYAILFPFPDGPAAEAGIQEGDRLLEIDGQPVEPGTPAADIAARVRGPEGQRVVLMVARPPEYERFTFTIVRQNIPLPSVTSNISPLDEKLGMIQVNLIATSTAGEIEEAITSLQAKGAEYFALDLRGNRGGLLDAGVSVSSLFLSDGVVLEKQYANENPESYAVEEAGPFVDLPLVVLVDTNTASAAEIVAGALQAQMRAPLIGTHTFGKDVIQLVFDLQDNSSLHVTAAKWWVPGLENTIGEGGLQPDIQVTVEEGSQQDAFERAAVEYFNQ